MAWRRLSTADHAPAPMRAASPVVKVVFVVAAALSAGGCIKRTAPPPSTGATATGSGSGAGAAGAATGTAPRSSAAQEAANARLAGVPRSDLVGGAGIKAFQLRNEARKVEMTAIPVTSLPFDQALRLDVREGSDHEWAVQLQAPIAAAVAAGDALLATFYVRTEKPQAEAAAGQTEFVFELSQSPYTKSVQYPVLAGSDWARVQVRFKAAAAHGPGEAQLIFRLGYDPQIIDIGGIQVESFGKLVALNALPSTQAADRARERAATANAAAASAQDMATAPVEGGDLPIDVIPGQVLHPISPYVYGINSQPGEGLGVTVRRMGGNRQSAYNWENNASNAGSDYIHSSDEWPCTVLGFRDCNQPGAQLVDFAQANRRLGVESIVTVPMVDYVSADKGGAVSEAEKAPSKRWNRSVAHKPQPFTLSPDLSDGVVYQDELVNFLVQKLGPAARGGVRFYSLDNEPALWPGTHSRIHPEKTRYQEMIKRSEDIASGIVRLDPDAMILGGVMYGWSEFMTLQDAPDAKQLNGQFGGTYVDFLLASMKRLEAEHHARLMHVLDVHWYPEVKGTKRITENDVSARTIAARLQAPRSLWDPEFVEKSWITAQWGKPIRLIPWLQERIAERYPGTRLGMTEYNFGAGDHISGGLVQADVLGVFGREGLYLATYWGNGPGNGKLPGYIAAAFKLYRNYDGKGAAFGDLAVPATPRDLVKASAFAAVDSKHAGSMTILVINKDLRAAFNGKIQIKSAPAGAGAGVAAGVAAGATGGAKSARGAAAYARARVFTLDSGSPEIRELPPISIKDNQIAHRLPPLSATLFVCERL